MTGRRDYAFNGPVDLRSLRDLDLRGCHLHLNGPFRLQDLVGVDLANATIIINPQGSGQGSVPGYLSNNDRPTFHREWSIDSPQDGRINAMEYARVTAKNKRKRMRTNSAASHRQSSVSLRTHEDMTPGRLRYDDYEEGETESSPPHKRHANSSINGIHPTRARMLEAMGSEDFHGDAVEPLIDRRTKANIAPMPFNRLAQHGLSAAKTTDKHEQLGLQQNPGVAAVVAGSEVSDEENFPRARWGAVGSLLPGAGQTLLHYRAQYTPWKEQLVDKAEEIAIKREQSSSPVPGIPGGVRTDVSYDPVAGESVMGEEPISNRGITEATVIDNPSEHPANGSVHVVPEAESASTDGLGQTEDADTSQIKETDLNSVRLFIEHVDRAATEHDLRRLFANYTVCQVRMFNNLPLTYSSGYAIVDMETVEDSRRASATLATAQLHGREFSIKHIPTVSAGKLNLELGQANI